MGCLDTLGFLFWPFRSRIPYGNVLGYVCQAGFDFSELECCFKASYNLNILFAVHSNVTGSSATSAGKVFLCIGDAPTSISSFELFSLIRGLLAISS